MKGWAIAAALAASVLALLGAVAASGLARRPSKAPPVVVDRGEPVHKPVVTVQARPTYDEFGPDPTRVVGQKSTPFEPEQATVEPPKARPRVSLSVEQLDPRRRRRAKPTVETISAAKPSLPAAVVFEAPKPAPIAAAPPKPAPQPAPRVEPPREPTTRRVPIVVRRESNRERELREEREQLERDREWRRRTFEKWEQEERERERRRREGGDDR